ncbi:excinuclease ABC subunit A [Pandoraea cepalis]|uniref:Excinuclease ABC subunit A n=1 Tax=Pandoraea cepalis TaxID=2508294 RepID=A0A5E4WT47_9BURK|nr:excinuclease ABC subunit A [Pandoraea cepalis]
MLFNGCRVRRWRAVEGAAMRRLQQLHAAATLGFLRAPPGNRLEALRGNRLGQYSIRINDQWRLCFRFDAGNASDVEIVDYH